MKSEERAEDCMYLSRKLSCWRDDDCSHMVFLDGYIQSKEALYNRDEKSAINEYVPEDNYYTPTLEFFRCPSQLLPRRQNFS